jgi:hypothetical protein
MKETRITIPELALVAGTRAALGAGVGLLLADCLTREQRRAVGWTLVLIGAATTIPIAFEVLGGRLRDVGGSRQMAGESASEASWRPARQSELVPT